MNKCSCCVWNSINRHTGNFLFRWYLTEQPEACCTRITSLLPCFWQRLAWRVLPGTHRKYRNSLQWLSVTRISNYGVILPSEPSYDSEFQHFLRGKEIVLTGMSLPKVKGLSSEQSEAMVRLSRLPAFSDLVNKVEADEVSVIAPSSTVTYDLINNLLGTFLNVFLISFFFSLAILHVDWEQHSRAGCALSVVRREAVQ